MQNQANGPELPMGLSRALAENIQAMQFFQALSPEGKQAVISHTHQIRSRREMRDYVNSLVDHTPPYTQPLG